MTVLLVDDQISVLSGLISGLDWDALGVTSIRTANSAMEARRILKEETVELLLCDIEMPGENGLSLLRWARAQGLDFVCVFLTSHANFLYAKEAIQLNCFDYILQPARYEAIQATIAKAIARVRKESAEVELERYGAVAKSYSAGLFQGVFSDWIHGGGLSVPMLCDMLQRLGEDVGPESRCLVLLGQLLSWSTEPWATQEWVYAVNNIVAECYEEADCRAFPFGIDRTLLGWIIPLGGSQDSRMESLLVPLSRAYWALRENLPCDMAFYASPVEPIERINGQAGLLLGAKADNVLPKAGVFCPGEASAVDTEDSLPDSAKLHRWGSLLVQGESATAAKEACLYLDGLAERSRLNQDTLREFWIRFQQVVISAATQQCLDLREIISVIDRGSNGKSLSDVEAAVRSLAKCFPRAEDSQCKGDLIGRIKAYVDEHLDRPINVNDVAAALFMNSDYISRQFKAEEDISIKDYILREKMEAARILLQTTNLPISVISAKQGYDNFSYFSQVYRKVMGTSPKDERSRRSEEER